MFLARAECTAACPGSAWSHDLDLPGRWPGGFEWCTCSPSAEDVCANPTPPGFELRGNIISMLLSARKRTMVRKRKRERVRRSSSQRLHDYAYNAMCMHTTITYIACAHIHCVKTQPQIHQNMTHTSHKTTCKPTKTKIMRVRESLTHHN